MGKYKSVAPALYDIPASAHLNLVQWGSQYVQRSNFKKMCSSYFKTCKIHTPWQKLLSAKFVDCLMRNKALNGD